MTSLISTILCLSGPTVYLFWVISMQSCLAMITMPGSPYNAKDMLSSLPLQIKMSVLDTAALTLRHLE